MKAYPNIFDVYKELFSSKRFNLKNVQLEIESSLKNLKFKEELNPDEKEEKIDKIKTDKLLLKATNLLKAFGIYNYKSEERLKKYFQSDKKFQELGKFLFPDYELKELNNGIDLQEKFKKINNSLGYFKEEDFEIYKQYYSICDYIAKVIEPDTEKYTDKIAYNLMVFFGNDLNKATNELKAILSKYSSNVKNPLKKLFNFTLPSSGSMNVEAWKKLLDKFGVKIVEFIEYSNKIEVLLGKPPKDYEETLKAIASVKYNNETQLGLLSARYSLTEKEYNKILKYLPKVKTQDSLPDFKLDIGKEIDPKYNGYYIVRLPASDLRGFILGKITNCCQSIGDDSEECAIDGMTRDNNGFYVVIKAGKNFDINNINWNSLEEDGHKIVGQSYFWRSKNFNIVFDSIEMLYEFDNEMMVKTMPVLAQKIFQLNLRDKIIYGNAGKYINRVMVGLGGKTPNEFGKLYPRLAYHDVLDEGYNYGDAKKQAIIGTDERAKEEIEFHSGRFENTAWSNYVLQAPSKLKAMELVMYLTNEHYIKKPIFLDLYYQDVLAFEKASNYTDSEEKILFKLIKNKTTEILHEVGVFLEFLSNLKNEQDIENLTSLNALNAFREGVSPEKLLGLSSQDFANFTSEKGIKLLKKNVDFEKYKGLSGLFFNFIFSKDAANIYQNKLATIEELLTFKGFNFFTKTIFVSELNRHLDITPLNSLYILLKAGIEIKDLINLTDEEYIVTASDEALGELKKYDNFSEFYNNYVLPQLDKFKDLNKEFFAFFYSENMKLLFEENLLKYDDLFKIQHLDFYKNYIRSDEDNTFINNKSRKHIWDVLKAGITIENLSKLTKEEYKIISSSDEGLEMFTRYNSNFEVYYNNYVLPKIEATKGLSKDFFNFIFSTTADLIIKNKLATFDDLLKLSHLSLDKKFIYNGNLKYMVCVDPHQLNLLDILRTGIKVKDLTPLTDEEYKVIATKEGLNAFSNKYNKNFTEFYKNYVCPKLALAIKDENSFRSLATNNQNNAINLVA